MQGANTVEVRQTDVAGNVSTPTSFAFTLDTVDPTAPTVALANDTGSSGTDKITDNASLALIGVECGATVEYSIDGGSNWSTSAPTLAQLAQGSNTVEVRQTDLAGNVSTPTSFAFTLDTVDPAAPTVALANDTGSSGSDQVTNDPSLTLTGIESGATVEYSLDGGSNWSTSAPTLAQLVQGSNTVEVRQTDVAGNVSSAGSLTFTLDTSTAAPGVALTTDSGSSASDHITNVGTLALSGLEAGATVSYSIDGGTTFTSSFSAVEGLNNVIVVRATDVDTVNTRRHRACRASPSPSTPAACGAEGRTRPTGSESPSR